MPHSRNKVARLARLSRSVALGALFLSSGAAMAQQDDGPQQGFNEADAAIIVTGSRIVRDGFESPSPVTVVGQDLLNQRAMTNVAEALNELPSFRALQTPATQQAVGGNIGARVLDLRGLGAPRTLVLLDGKRFVPSTTQGTIDVNLMPTALISRTEVVTGGASAAYGSDAVAGVVNFIIDKRFQGLKGSLQYGISEQGDAREWNATLAYGAAFADDRGHVSVAIEYNDSNGIGDCYARSWCPNEQLVGNSPAGYNGLPATIRTGPDAPGNLNQDGLINTTSGPLRGITFNPNGTTRNYQYGQIFGTNLSPLFTKGGEGTYENGYLQGILLLPPVQRLTIFGHFDYALSDALTVNFDLSWGEVKGKVVGSQARNAAFTIQRSNYYLNNFVAASVRNTMDANGITSFTLGRVFGDLGGAVDRSDNFTKRAVLSFEGNISEGWDWDAYYQYGTNDFRQEYDGNVIMTRMVNAVDAVSVAGVATCRINADTNLTNDDPACRPLNLFGRGNISPEARAYVAPSGYQSADTTEHVVAGNVRGDLFQLPGGAFKVAAGGEYRSDKQIGYADALSTANAFWSFNGKAINGKIEVIEGYLEAVAPLLSNVAFANVLELNGAIRQTHYNRSSVASPNATTVDATTWKIGGVWEPVDLIRFRVTRSRDIRAPNLTELFGPVTAGRQTIFDPANAGAQFQINAMTGANPNLAPEVADTWTAGVVLSPFQSLRFSVDYFDIRLKDAIGTLGANTIIQRCAAGATELCTLITRDSANQVTEVRDVLQNFNRQVNRGIDFEASYRTGLGRAGNLDLRLLATRYLELSTTDSAGTIDRAGQTGYRPGGTSGVPDWIVDGNILWSMKPVTFGIHGHYISSGIFEATFAGPGDAGYDVTKSNSISSNRVDSSFLVDLSASVDINSRFELFGAINNVFDKDPPLAASGQGGTNQIYFDAIGRYFKVGLRVKM